jgi:hypothetical protein
VSKICHPAGWAASRSSKVNSKLMYLEPCESFDGVAVTELINARSHAHVTGCLDTLSRYQLFWDRERALPVTFATPRSSTTPSLAQNNSRLF